MAETIIKNGMIIERLGNGKGRVVGYAGGGQGGAPAPGLQLKGPDPTQPYKGPNAAADLEQKRQQIEVERLRAQNEQRKLNMPQMIPSQPGMIWDPAARKAIPMPGIPEKDAAKPLTEEQLREVRMDALEKINLARRLQEKSRNGWFATGALAPTMAGWGGTTASDVKAGSSTLKSAGALAKILQMTQATGKNPFTPMSNSDVDLIANAKANLDISQSDEEYQRNARLLEDAYRRGWIGAGGKPQNLEAGLEWQRGLTAPRGGKPSPEQDLRDNPALAPQFDAKYGAGAAKRVLGGK